MLNVAFSPDGKRFLTGGNAKTAKVWDAQNGREVLALEGNDDKVWSAAWSPDGKRIVTSSTGYLSGSVKVCEVTTGKAVHSFEFRCDRAVFSRVSWSPDGRRIVGGVGSTLRVWDPDKGHEICSLKGHLSNVLSVAFSPDGTRILSGSGDHTAKVWDAWKDQEVLSLEGHESYVDFAAWSPDGKRILTRDFERVRVWDPSRGRELLAMKGVEWSPDGKRILFSTTPLGHKREVQV